MKTTTLKGSGDAGEIVISIETSPESKGEDGKQHDWLVDRVHRAMSDSGCWAHAITAETDEEE